MAFRCACGWRVVVAVSAVAVLAVHATGQPTQAQALEPPCDIRTTERVVAIGDVHGAYEQFLAILRAAGLIDRRDRWAGGRARLVQTGDVVDRGPDSRKVIDLLRRLEREAARAGGRVHALLGNHEFMRLVGDWRYVSPGELKAFQTADSANLRERAHDIFAAEAARQAKAENRPFDARDYRTQFFKEIALGHLETQMAYGREGDYGRWIRNLVPAVRINGILYLHGGVSDTVADLGCDGLNAEVQRDMASLPVPAGRLMSLLSSTEDGPLWYRGMAAEPEETFAPTLDSILRRMKARAVVIGHTPTAKGQVTTRFGGRVILIDTGMLNGEFYPGGVPSALEVDGDAFTAIYEGRRQPLDVPVLRTPS